MIISSTMEARVEVSSGIAGRQLPIDFHREDDIYTSPGYPGADNAVDLEVSHAIGRRRVLRARRE